MCNVVVLLIKPIVFFDVALLTLDIPYVSSETSDVLT